MVALHQAHRELWATMAEEAGLLEHAERLFPHAVPCFLVDALTPGAGLVGASRLGGTPDLPPTLAWPTHGERHLTFLGQLDLSALQQGWVDELPATGWLYFFLGVDEPAFEVAHKVLYFEGPRDALAPATPPLRTRPIEDTSSIDFAAHAVRFRPSLVFDDKLEQTLGLEEFALEFLTATNTQIGGLPVSWHHDPRVDAYLLRSGYAPLLFRTHLTPERLEKQASVAWADADERLGEELERAAEMLRAFRADEPSHRARMASWRVLFLVGSHREVGMCWWDAGLLQFLIHSEDLQARRFDRTYCCVASS